MPSKSTKAAKNFMVLSQMTLASNLMYPIGLIDTSFDPSQFHLTVPLIEPRALQCSVASMITNLVSNHLLVFKIGHSSFWDIHWVLYSIIVYPISPLSLFFIVFMVVSVNF
jgi:hypothetical protein